MGFTESTAFPTLQDMLSSYFYPGEEEIEEVAEFAGRLKADNGPDYLQPLCDDIARFLQTAGNQVEERFAAEFLSYFSPPDGTVRDWLSDLETALRTPVGS